MMHAEQQAIHIEKLMDDLEENGVDAEYLDALKYALDCIFYVIDTDAIYDAIGMYDSYIYSTNYGNVMEEDIRRLERYKERHNL